jgi:hypothetical protein
MLNRREFLVSAASLSALPFFRQDRSDLKLETIRAAGPADNRVNIVFLAEGYTREKLDRFDRSIETLLKEAWADPPLKEYSSWFNTYRISTVSMKEWDGTGVGTYFGTRANSADRTLLVDWPKVYLKLPSDLPEKRIVVMIVHQSEGVRAHGGGAEQYGHLATGASTIVFRHELGHALGLLADEYPDGGTTSDLPPLNATENPDDPPWRAAIERGVQGVGVHKVAGLKRTFYRAEQQCVMHQNDPQFGAVCRWGMILGIHRHARIIDEYGTNKRPIPARFIPEIKIKLLTVEGVAPRLKWGYRRVKSDEADQVLRSVQAKDYRLDTFSEKFGWTILPGDLDEKTGAASLRTVGLPEGTSIVTAFAQDQHPSILADPAGVTVDARSWIVEKS